MIDALLYAFLCLIWGSTWLAIKVGLEGVPPFLGAGLRFVISAAFLGGCLCASINLVTMKRHAHRVDPLVLNVFGMALGATCLLAMSAVMERSLQVAWNERNVLALLYLSVFGSVIAFTAYFRLIKVMDATIVSLSTLVIPIVALALGYFFLNETLTLFKILGIGIVPAGVAVAIAPAQRRSS